MCANGLLAHDVAKGEDSSKLRLVEGCSEGVLLALAAEAGAPARTCASIVARNGLPRLADVDRVTGEPRRRPTSSASAPGPTAPGGGVLAENNVGIFACSTFNTDYIFVKEENFEKALNVLSAQGYTVQ